MPATRPRLPGSKARNRAVPARHASEMMGPPDAGEWRRALRNEWFLVAGLVSSLIFLAFQDYLFAGLANPLWLGGLLLWLFVVVLGSALRIAHHAEIISEWLGEPYGTLVLTLSITSVEAMSITAVMLHGADNPTLVRDTLYSVVMIVLGGMIGTSLLLGAIRHREQHYNLQGANAYFGVIVPLAVFSLVMPDFTTATRGPTLSQLQQILLGGMASGLYLAFLLLQTGRHHGYFVLPDEPTDSGRAKRITRARALPSVLLLFAYMIPVILLVEHLARPIDYMTETLEAPAAIGGVIMAILVATPEATGAVRAALHNRLQHSINVSLGSALSTIGLTVPIMLAVAWITGHNLILGLQHAELMLLVLTLTVSLITFTSGRTNVLQGAVHVLLFVSFLVFVFQD